MCRCQPDERGCEFDSGLIIKMTMMDGLDGWMSNKRCMIGIGSGGRAKGEEAAEQIVSNYQFDDESVMELHERIIVGFVVKGIARHGH
jgi:hypothetical protein